MATEVPTPAGAACERCAGPPVPGHNFCEGCGRDLRQVPRQFAWRSSTAPPGPCESCGGNGFTGDGFCEGCGRRRGAGQDHLELALGPIAAVTDKGRHKSRNEDALAIGRIGELSVAVVCDGVSSSARADQAAHAAVDAGVTALLVALEGGESPRSAITAAAGAAATAVADLDTAETAHSPPSCTFVAAVVTGSEVVVGSVGDSRAYWLAEQPGESQRLTTDDSLGAQLAAAGLPADAEANPRLNALARWLGADSGDTEARVTVLRPSGPGRLLLCSDGLSRYRSDPAELAATAPGAPAETARALNQLSLEAGGVDNIAIVIIPFPAVLDSGPASRPEEAA